jgi:hypothetical protein
MEKIVNTYNVELKIGDKIIITKDKLGNKILANVEKDEVLIITGFSDDGKIMYHNISLALPVNSNIYKKIE